MFMREQDAISGKEAKAFITINGQTEELFFAKSLEATAEKNKVDVPMLGRMNTPQRAAGWSGTGTLTVYYITSKYRELMRQYMETGQDFWFDLQVVNEASNTSGIGKQTVVLKDCNVDSMVIARFDATSDDMLEEEIPFTFTSIQLLTPFNTVTGV
jgi:hypothetical protein